MNLSGCGPASARTAVATRTDPRASSRASVELDGPVTCCEGLVTF